MRFLSIFLATSLAVGGHSLVAAPDRVKRVPIPSPTDIPSPSDAKSDLEKLKVAPAGDMSGYSRDKFPHWHTVNGTCNTREVVLIRDGTNVKTDSACKATSGTWKSPYDDGVWNATSDVDIDHMVPLANAWISGASAWTTSKREDFANDLTRPQLWAVTDNVNQQKSDHSPDQWKPPLKTFYCTYASSWVQVKDYWQLTITSEEKTALSSMLDSC